ncbi:hypothetical protein FOQG_17461 [Fusarium oxysporum f. sp. raphani 54005]|uniref:Uncharacterized protein n=1 Tax=Fusarium oxysporum f. sp. raphani 54005 TaxID=1089458 RepID=X0B7V5_FUSOX|nr:hypothetical protein FOQG_17461 [Fusarium oxysporum f. sp. raphani 54005]
MPGIEQLPQYDEEESLADGQGVKCGVRRIDGYGSYNATFNCAV